MVGVETKPVSQRDKRNLSAVGGVMEAVNQRNQSKQTKEGRGVIIVTRIRIKYRNCFCSYTRIEAFSQ